MELLSLSPIGEVIKVSFGKLFDSVIIGKRARAFNLSSLYTRTGGIKRNIVIRASGKSFRTIIIVPGKIKIPTLL